MKSMGGIFHADQFRDKLETIIQQFKLIDPPLTNGKYTWTNRRAGIHNIKERLDRLLVQERVAKIYQTIRSRIVHGTASDHKAVVLSMDKGSNFGPLPFKYNRSWDSHEAFRTLVKEQWLTEVIGSPHFIWESKLKHLRTAIKQWARENASAEMKKKAELHLEMERWHKEKEQMQYTAEDLNKEKELYKELYRQNRMEEEEQRIKSRCLWLKAGDKNTSFFHNTVKIRRAINQINRIEGVVYSIECVGHVQFDNHSTLPSVVTAVDCLLH